MCTYLHSFSEMSFWNSIFIQVRSNFFYDHDMISGIPRAKVRLFFYMIAELVVVDTPLAKLRLNGQKW